MAEPLRIAVTGASGYLGAALVTAASRHPGLSVRAVTRTGADWLPAENMVIDRLDADAERAVEGVDTVVHLAGPNEVVTAQDPVAALASAVAAGRAVAQACAVAGTKRLVYVSTVHVYGAALAPGTTVHEGTVPEPRHPYAIARLAVEHILAAEAGPADLVVLRLTNGVGAPAHPAVQRWTLLANDLCRQAARGGPLQLSSDGYQWRDFIALADVGRIVLAAAGAERPGVPPGTYNLGSGRSMTVREVAQLVLEEAERAGLGRLRLEAPAGRTGPTEPYQVSTGRLDQLQLSAEVPVRQAIADTIAFCLAHPS